MELGPHEYNSAKAQGLVVTLPKKQVEHQLVPPAAGTKSWWSGQGNMLSNTMSRQVTLPAGQPASLTFQANWDIEDCGTTACDYAYVDVNDGSGAKPIKGSITKDAEGNGIDGKSNGWVPATFDLSAYAGKTITLQFRYATDPATGGLGFFADDIKVTSGSATVLSSGAETSPDGWTLKGFSAAGASYTSLYDNYYLASNINYVDYDKHLQTGPYNYAGSARRPARRALPVPGRSADLVLGHVAGGQQHQRAPGLRPDPADRLASDADQQHGRERVATAGFGVRRAVRAGEGGLVHAAPQRAAELHPRPERGPDLQRQQVVLVRGPADEQRQGPEQRSEHQGRLEDRHLDEGSGVQA